MPAKEWQGITDAAVTLEKMIHAHSGSDTTPPVYLQATIDWLRDQQEEWIKDAQVFDPHLPSTFSHSEMKKKMTRLDDTQQNSGPGYQVSGYNEDY